MRIKQHKMLGSSSHVVRTLKTGGTMSIHRFIDTHNNPWGSRRLSGPGFGERILGGEEEKRKEPLVGWAEVTPGGSAGQIPALG